MVKKIKSVELLPEFLRTDKNKKFLSSTIDQLIQPPSLERLDGFVGSKLSPNYKSSQDNYIADNSTLRQNYQLSPALIINDTESNVSDVISFDDLVNEIKNQGGHVNNLDRLFKSDYYTYKPFIDWDKFVNYQEYYWLVTGPQTIEIVGQPQNTTSTYTVVENESQDAFVFSPDSVTQDPLLTLYRGNTYIFDVTSSQPFYIKSLPTGGTSDIFTNNITNNGTSTGLITLIVNESTPDNLYYVGGNNSFAQGQIVVRTIEQDTVIDVENEIVGKKNYTSGTGIKLSNGMKIQFGGTVTPSTYRNKEYFVEGVGKAIQLIDYGVLSSSADMADIYNDNFDMTPFDSYPFDSFKNLPIDPEYITINRASKDLNPWTRYNRWVHSDVIKLSAEANGQVPVLPADKRAKRPIIEFLPNLQLYNFGSVGIQNVDLIDNTTTDAFSIVEGSAGYYVDEVLLDQGHRIIFNADLDSEVCGRIYVVNYNFINGNKKLELLPASDNIPPLNAAVGIISGKESKGTNWWYNGSKWIYAQQHNKLNEPPLFDLYDNDQNSYSLNLNTTFAGNKIFGYTPGTIFDSVLGIYVKQENSVGIGSYSFKNFLMTETFDLIESESSVISVLTNKAFVKVNNESGVEFKNAWMQGNEYQVPIIQFNTILTATSYINVVAADLSKATYAKFDLYFNNVNVDPALYTIAVTNGLYKLQFENNIPENTNILLKIESDGTLNESQGYYELPIIFANNPNNDIVNELTLSEIGNHVSTIIKSDEFTGKYPGNSNLRDLSDVDKFTNQIITNINPGLFANFFIGKKDHSVLNAITISANNYAQFKLSLIKKISEISGETDPVVILDQALRDLNVNKTELSPYFLSDMIGYGSDKTIKKWNVTNVNNVIYPLTNSIDFTQLSLTSALVYLNNVQLLIGLDYTFLDDSSFEILKELTVGDVITVVEYFSTEGCFVPPTPTKLGLYPKFEPSIFFDDTYVNGPTKVIQGHDGSITIAFNDYRDDVILEYEKRVYNNIKVSYRNELLDHNAVIPGAFRKVDYSITEVNQILQQDFISWAGTFGIEYEKNTAFDLSNPFTWNYKNSYNAELDLQISGYWRSLYKYFYDTDRPHTCPWEMLGFSNKPEWWESEYGLAPYTSGNEILWNDLEAGNIRHGDRRGIHQIYARPMLSSLLPVDEYGNLVDPTVRIAENITASNQRQSFVFGDQGPAETAWRRSSFWPFAVQKLLALTKPAGYASLMYDPIRIKKNIAGQWVYGEDQSFVNLKTVTVQIDKNTLTSGYSVFVTEVGKQKNSNYITKLLTDIQNYDVNLFQKIGGFVSKEKLQIIIDAYDPISNAPGAILPQEDYRLILNTSNAVKSLGISGIVIQKVDGKYLLKGYDANSNYFTVYTPIRNANTPTITVGGVTAPYSEWSGVFSSGNTGLTDAELTTANTSATSRYYQQGQYILYQNKFYIVKISHYAKSTFTDAYFQQIPKIPTKGGATVQIESKFDKVEKIIPYGSTFNTIQEVYDIIIGYGAWLEDQGFIFDQFNSNINEVINWKFSAKEFLYWSTQGWASNNIIALSPFADKITFKASNGLVDNLFNNYKLLQVNGTALPKNNISVSRDDGLCSISVTNSQQGIYFAKLDVIQKEHALVFNNRTIFNDTIYDPETGYKQSRMKLVGFRTKDWDGDYFSPGFVYDTAIISLWEKNKKYVPGDLVRYVGKYYSAINSSASDTFNFSDWAVLSEKPKAELLPNFDYKIKQFDDFYSLDIDNFDAAQQSMAQHLIGYTPRTYFSNIFTNPTTQYKFYQGFIREKGTKNAISKLAKATLNNLQGEMTFNEIWAFRLGQFGSYETFKEIEFPLIEGTFIDNPQVINFVNEKPANPNDLIHYQTADSLLIKPTDYDPSNTFVTISSTFDDNNFQLKTAGYVRLDDVTSTAFNKDSLFDIANNGLVTVGDTIWIGFDDNGEWDVLHYSRVDATILSATSNEDNTQITLTTNIFHDLEVNDLISITQLDSNLNGIYKVIAVPSLNKFVIKSTQVDIDISNGAGLIFKFASHRFDTFNSLYNDSKLLNLNYGTKFWVDKDINDKWTVYEKVKNYTSITPIKTSTIPDSNQFGFSIKQQKNNNIVLVGAPNFYDSINFGKLYVYKENDNGLASVCRFTLNEDKTYYAGGSKNEFGYTSYYDSIEYKDTGYGLIFTGAPATSNVISDSVGIIRQSTGTGITSSYVHEGCVKISSINPLLEKENTEVVLLSPYPASYQRFGSSIYVQANTSTKLTLIGAPGSLSTGTGKVYAYHITANTSTNLQIVAAPTGIEVSQYGFISTGSQWGYSISGSFDAKTIAISAPGFNNQRGQVQIFSGTNYVQTLSVPQSVQSFSRFGEKILVSPSGSDIFVTAPGSANPDNTIGKVIHYQKDSSSTFQIKQIILNPDAKSQMQFGRDIDFDSNKNLLIISAVGTNNRIRTTFDNYTSPSNVPLINDSNSELRDNITIFDANSTIFTDGINRTGTVYLYDNKESKFILADEIYPRTYSEGDNYGYSVLLGQNSIFVGAPALTTTTNISYLHTFVTNDKQVSGYKVLRKEDDLVDVDLFNRNMLIDTDKEEIIDYLDVIDPLKGKIAGLAQQELSYRAEIDPAIYSIGTASTINDPTTNWLDDHVGELWWDLSSIKYMWYEQGDINFRKTYWGKVFPGSTIDVYEWVKSEYLPSEWATLADTPSGLTKAISGQPKYPDNSVVSVKQIIDPVTGTFIDVYYFWVKNKVTIPSIKNRRISSLQVANIIADPITYGLKTLQILSKDALSISNVSAQLVDSKVTLNSSFDIVNNSIPKHTEWLLLKENSENSVPNALLEKKLIDSLLGRDNLGNVIPDPTLSFREKYGISIRPRQSMFKNRYEALRNVVEFVNDVLIKNLITDNYSFKNLNKEELPTLNHYDIIVEDLEFLSLEVEDPTILSTGKLTAYVKNGKLYNVVINDPGFGYKYPPTVEVVNNAGHGAEIETVIDDQGRITAVKIVNSGKNFASAPQLIVRPFTAIVLVDENANRRWSKYQFNKNLNVWNKVSSQKYNTKLYWDYVDWISDDFKPYLDFTYTLNDVFQLKTLTNVEPGQYIKIKNGGSGRFIILEKTKTNESGTFSNDYNIVYSEKGTIQLSNNLWNFSTGNLTFDYNNTYDQTLYDQAPEDEIYNIFKALKDDIFVNELKINWNLLFFKSVRYALSEQKLLDWAFKTSFIDVVNNAGNLDQRPVYKLENQNSAYQEKYLNEIKPYHTVVRNFTTVHTTLDQSNSDVTDFDLPNYYNNDTNSFEKVDLNNSLINEYPWKSWKDNYKNFVESIIIADSGNGYTSAPLVSIQAKPGDTGTGATAKAYISSGKISSIEVLTPGAGYTQSPNVVLSGGGNNVTLARAYARLGNNKVRANTIGIKFDRISNILPSVNNKVSDSFVCDGYTKEFELSWPAQPDRLQTTVTLNNSLVLSSEYTIKYGSKQFNNYSKKISTIIFNTAPPRDKILSINYVKNVEIFNALERIMSSYTSTNNVIGNDISQLISGLEYPYNNISGLSFNYSSNWDVEYQPFGQFAYADNIEDSNEYVVSTTVGAGNSTISLTTVTGITVGQFANITSYLQNKFSSSTVKVVSITGNNVTFNSTLSGNLIPGDIIEIWSPSLTPTAIDTELDGGSWITTTSNISNATGINPEDVIVSGDGFFTTNNLYSPEELVAGSVTDTLGINVYTRNSYGAPLIFSGYGSVIAGEITYIPLSVLPPSGRYITVTFNNTLLNFNDAVRDPVTDFSAMNQFTIDWKNSQLIINMQDTSGQAAYTIIGLGFSSNGLGVGLVDSVKKTVYNTNRAQIKSQSLVSSVGSAYVTVNGVALPRVSTSTQFGYMLTTDGNGSNKAAVDVYFNSPFPDNTVQVYFFSDNYKYFNEIQEQSISVGGTPQSVFTLLYPPGVDNPLSAGILVTKTDPSGSKRLLPPIISYYKVTDTNVNTFAINTYSSDSSKYNISLFDITTVKVFVNGSELRPGFDFLVPAGSGTVVLNSAFVNLNNEIAIECLVQGLTSDLQFDYTVSGNNLILQAAISNATLSLITYNDHDSLLLRTERFVGAVNRRYKISRPVLNDNYVWVMVNGIPLISGADFEILDDQVTIQVSDAYTHSPSDNVVIMSFSSEVLASTVLGYRIFKDIFNRTHFTRLSKNNTTYLTKELRYTDTEIHVADSGALTTPIVSKKIPGVVLINGERIEFYKVEGNVLTQLRRNTMGTGPADINSTGTRVLDQGSMQTIPYSINTYKQVLITTGTNVYTISTVTNEITGDGITLSQEAYIPAKDQISVYYGSKLLQKHGHYYQDISKAFDSYPANIKGTTSTVVGLPSTALKYDAYLVTATNHVWVYTGSKKLDSINGFEYNGLDYIPPEFYVNTATQQVILNIPNGVSSGVKLTIIKKDFNRNTSWQNELSTSTTLSLLDSTTLPAQFLQKEPAELPNNYYYGDPL